MYFSLCYDELNNSNQFKISPFYLDLWERTDLFTESSQTVLEALPEVFEERTVNFLQTVFGTGINADVKLRYGHQIPTNKQQTINFYLHTWGSFILLTILLRRQQSGQLLNRNRFTTMNNKITGIQKKTILTVHNSVCVVLMDGRPLKPHHPSGEASCTKLSGCAMWTLPPVVQYEGNASKWSNHWGLWSSRRMKNQNPSNNPKVWKYSHYRIARLAGWFKCAIRLNFIKNTWSTHKAEYL